MTTEDIQEQLFSLADPPYRSLQTGIIPNIPPEFIIGVRTPALRSFAKELSLDSSFLFDLPHRYFEVNQLHSFVISRGKDFKTVASLVDAFLPYVDNWAVCDQMNPAVFRRNREALLPYIYRWISSDHPYTVRFAVKMLMDHFLDVHFRPEYLQIVASIDSEEYYVRMMVAWYFATALAKQYDSAVSYITENKLERWTHNKAIQKAVESFRIRPDQKEYLKQFRRKA